MPLAPPRFALRFFTCCIERAGPGAALEAAGAGGGGSVLVLRESSGKKAPFVLKVSYGGILRVSGAGEHTCPQPGW